MAPCHRLLNERDQLTSAQIDQQQKLAEHDLVIKTLEPLDAERKCFRLVGDVLVERTVGEVLPAVKSNRDHLAAVSTGDERSNPQLVQLRSSARAMLCPAQRAAGNLRDAARAEFWN